MQHAINIFHLMNHKICYAVPLQILQAKVKRLEHLLQLKEIRILDLQTRMQDLKVKQYGQ